MEIKIADSWKTALKDELAAEYFTKLAGEVRSAYLAGQPPIYPPAPLVFNAFNLTPLNQVKVVILGQDPYHGPGQAMGLSFSVPDGERVPPSLKNIYKELSADLSKPIPQSGNLEHWATQGVLLLNATLTVAAGAAGSHQGKGWEEFTDAVIETISDTREHVVFLLWGAYAAKKASLIDNTKHLILTAPHPSPLSAHRGFFGCRHFSKTNQYLVKHNLTTITW